jgi:hypothetical protein
MPGMDVIRRHRLSEAAWLAVTLAILTVGLAMIAWGWRNAHNPASPRGSDAAHHHNAVTNPSEFSTPEGHK